MKLNKRLIFWLIQAYIRKWGKIILLSFVFGLVVFFLLINSFPFFLRLIPSNRPVIGVTGIYTRDTFPSFITERLSQGLTTLNEDGTVSPGVATKWNILNDGKTYEFHLDKKAKYADGTPLTSENISYNFKDVKIETPSKYVIRFTLKEQYAPFLVTASRPITKNQTIGVSGYKIEGVKSNGEFLQSLRLFPTSNRLAYETYQFYPSQQALKTAFLLGEVNKVIGLTETEIDNHSLLTFPHVETAKETNYTQLVTLFYSQQDSLMSDKRLRNALSYSLPNEFPQGKRAYLPYPHTSLFFNTELPDKTQDMPHAKALLSLITENGKQKPPALTVKYLSKYKSTAELIEKEWKKLGVHITLEEVDKVPQVYQIYLGDFSLPKDPDQYALWHSAQVSNITRYDSPRIDKLLEDGRKESETGKRQQLYFDFQKYLQDDSPASFLYFPYTYTLTRN